MGCDIHAHVEVKIEGTWHHYNILPLRRDYALFGRLAGVRDTTQPVIVPPRGLPTDLSRISQIEVESWGRDGHTHSWLSGPEIEEVRRWHEAQIGSQEWYRSGLCSEWGYLFGNHYHNLKKYPNDYPSGYEDMRMIFWFDS